MSENVSEIARIRQRIAEEYQAAQAGLNGLAAGACRHQFIHARMERIGEAFTALAELVGSRQEAMQVVA